MAHRGDQQGPPSESANGDDPAGRPRPHPAAAGQHYVVRLTADDGYTASRSYSVCSAPSDPLLEMLIEKPDAGRFPGPPPTWPNPATWWRSADRSAGTSSGTAAARHGDRRWDRSGANRRDAAACHGDRGHRPVHPGGGGQNDCRSALRRRVHRAWCDDRAVTAGLSCPGGRLAVGRRS